MVVNTGDPEALRDLIVHCWIHSGYPNCGYSQMTAEQKQLYDSVLEEEHAVARLGLTDASANHS